VRSILTERDLLQAELSLLGRKQPNKPPWMIRRWDSIFMLTWTMQWEKWRAPWGHDFWTNFISWTKESNPNMQEFSYQGGGNQV
jgi:hypothetical protein